MAIQAAAKDVLVGRQQRPLSLFGQKKLQRNPCRRQQLSFKKQEGACWLQAIAPGLVRAFTHEAGKARDAAVVQTPEAVSHHCADGWWILPLRIAKACTQFEALRWLAV